MRKLFLTVAAVFLLASAAWAEKKDIHSLSVNDIHAKIQNFPQLASIVDSLRTLYPDLLVMSAGDNRTGDPLNDLYEIPAYPMVALMNQVGFDCSTLGNHEFDGGQDALARDIDLSNFPYICCNIHPDPKFGIHTIPYKIFTIDDVRIAVIGAVQVGKEGHPDTHPDNCEDILFTPAEESLLEYRWLGDENDVVILLTHIGYDADVELSASARWADLIIGGHSHTQIQGGEVHNGVMITQVVNRLDNVTHITLTVQDGKVTERKAENIKVEGRPGQNKIVAEMVRYFSDNPAFKRVLATLSAPMTSYEELGCMMTDAWRVETGSDIAFTNTGGVRYDYLPAGPFTVSDVLRLDPFGNDLVQFSLTGQELKDMLIATGNGDSDYGFPKVSGILCELIPDKQNASKIKDVKITLPDGGKFDLKKTYKVVTNSYVAATVNVPHKDPGRDLNRTTSDTIQAYLEHQKTIDYTGVCRVKQGASAK